VGWVKYLGSRNDWSNEATAFSRAFGGAFLFGTPLLYTMETWWIGEYANLWKLIAFLVLAFVANLALSFLSGFRWKSGRGIRGHLDQAVDAVAVGIVGSIIVLLVLNRLQADDSADAIVGKIVIQAIPLSIGASIAGAIFAPGRSRTLENDHHSTYLSATVNDIGATMIGGFLFGVAIAPTEEVTMLASQLRIGHELALVALSLIVGYVIIFASGFDPQSSYPSTHGPLQHPVTETVVAYVVSLGMAFITLYLFDQIEINQSVFSNLSQVLVLGFPTMVGGAAGRLVV
jgi:putative integral membrane protein (TIGR02587 family)